MQMINLAKNLSFRFLMFFAVLFAFVLLPFITSHAGSSYFIPWQFVTFEEPEFDSAITGRFTPQTVAVQKRLDNGWAKISTYCGYQWVYTRGNVRNVNGYFHIFNGRGGTPIARLTPQMVTVLEEYDNWYLISTWLGPRWATLTPLHSPDARLVALTFDDGPSWHTIRLLDELAARNVPATFYVLGSQVERYPHLAQRIVNEGHEIANHTFSHPRLTTVNANTIRNELTRTSDIIFQTTGVRPVLMRPPFGAHNQTVQNVAGELGYPIALWSLDTRDWESRNVNAIMSRFVNSDGTLRVTNGSNILFHDTLATSVCAAILLVDMLLEEGFTFVTNSQLLAERYGVPVPGQVYRGI